MSFYMFGGQEGENVDTYASPGNHNNSTPPSMVTRAQSPTFAREQSPSWKHNASTEYEYLTSPLEHDNHLYSSIMSRLRGLEDPKQANVIAAAIQETNPAARLPVQSERL